MHTTKVRLKVGAEWIECRRHVWGDKEWFTDMHGNRVVFDDMEVMG